MSHIQGRTYWIIAVFIAIVGIALRTLPFSEQFFPLNDGALFLAFAEHIRDGEYFSDPCVRYNGSCIPFAYPPLSFFAVAGLLKAGVSPIDAAVIYPLALSIMIMIAGFVLVREATDDPAVQLVAFAAIVLQKRSIEFLLMGGGISRSTGALLFLIALIAAFRLREKWTFPALLTCGMAIGGTVLSHLEWGINAVLGVSILLLVGGSLPFRTRFVILCLLAGISAAVVLPWFVWIVSTQGMGPFQSASNAAHWDASLLLGLLNLEIFPTGLGLICAIGAGALMQRRDYAWPLMLAAFFIGTPRHFDSVAVIPTSILLAFGVIATVNLGQRIATEFAEQIAARLAVGAVFGSAFALAGLLYWTINSNPSFRQLSPDVQAAADWARDNIGSDAKSVIVSATPWYISREAEWWPYLSQHTNLNTVQGSEWLGDGKYFSQIRTADVLTWRGDCVTWFEHKSNLGAVTYIIDVVDSGCFEDAAKYKEVFSRPDVKIFAVLP